MVCELLKIGDNIMAMTVEKRGNKLYIEIDLEKPTPSSSGKTLVVASTHGNTVTNIEIDGKPITIGINAYISK
jgi:sRNA-binding carbon storage regulator CsrA